MLNMYVGKNLVKVDESNLLSMDINVLKGIPYNVASKYAEYISAIEVCVEDCLDIPTDIHDEVTYMEALVELETIMVNDKEDEVMGTSNTKLNEVTNENKKEEVIMNGSNVTIETVNEKEMEGMMSKVNEVKGSMEEAVADMMNKFVEAKENIKVGAGMTKDEYVDKVDDSLNVMKGAFGSVINTLDNITGCSVLKDSILKIMEADADKDLFVMARKCRELIDEEIEFLEDCGNEVYFKKAVQLRALTEGARGKSIFEAFVSGCIWIGKKAASKLKIKEDSILAGVAKAISGFASILRAGVKLVWNTAKFAVSFVVAGVIKVADFVYRTIRTIVTKIKDFAVEKYERFTNKDFVDDLEEDLDDDFFADDEE